MISRAYCSMNLEMIEDLWEKDSKIDNDDLHLESTKIPSLHSKYYKIYNNILLLKKGQENKFKVLRREKWEYYTGKAPPDVYANKPFDLKVLKADVGIYMEADGELQQIGQKIEYQQQIVNYLEKILREINNRNWTIRNTIEWKKFIHGE